MSSAQRSDLAERFDFLKEVPLFAPVKDGVLAYLAEDFRERTYRKGETFFHQGDHNRELYIIKKGKVRIYHLSPNGNETTIAVLTSRQLIGEFAVIDGRPRSATAKAITPCTVLEMREEVCLAHLETIPGLALAMCKQLVNKARWTSMYAETIAQFDAGSRLLHFLLAYNEEFGREEEAGKRYVLELGLNQGDLATLVGARRGWVNHILQQWRNRGLIEFNSGVITILDLPRVQQEHDSRIEAGSHGI